MIYPSAEPDRAAATWVLSRAPSKQQPRQVFSLAGLLRLGLPHIFIPHYFRVVREGGGTTLRPQDSPPADLISMKSFIHALDLIQWELLDVRMDPISLRQGDQLCQLSR